MQIGGLNQSLNFFFRDIGEASSIDVPGCLAVFQRQMPGCARTQRSRKLAEYAWQVFTRHELDEALNHLRTLGEMERGTHRYETVAGKPMEVGVVWFTEGGE